MKLGFFERVGDVVRSSVEDNAGIQTRAHRGGVKVWFGDETAGREHYEAQLVSNRHLDGGDGYVLEIGFHAEHRDAASNQRALDRILAARSTWKEIIGECLDAPDEIVHDIAIADHFLGNSTWRRISETWAQPDLDDEELGFETGARLADYITAFQPVLASG